MITTRENLLRSIIHDVQLESNSGNKTDVLDVVWQCFKRLFPARAKGIEEKNNSTDNSDGDDSGGKDDDDNSDENVPDPPSEDTPSEEDLKQIAEQEARKKELGRREKLREASDSHLNDIGISAYNLSFEAFKRDVWSSESSIFDLVLGAVPLGSPRNVLAENLPTFCTSVLKTGSYVFLIISESVFSKF